ncbi:hypothetical protein N7490_005262 [Penicillium lividum]|nr:hypothetical protein N7490_005262 [Penicillium lividum]
MLSKRQKAQPQLQVPVPAFPLSSPITEELDGSSCSSAEDHELERSRPFDFLVKSTRQKVENSQKEGNRSPNLSNSHRGYGDTPRLSLRGITKKRKAPKPVGLNLVTDFSLSAPSPKRQPDDIAAPFVDLNDLKQLSKAREKERSAQKDKTKSGSRRRAPRTGPRLEPSDHNGSFLNPDAENRLNNRSESGLSPSDRHVMIGLTVPYHESSDRARELDSAGDQPLTPSIIVTPACEEAPWSVDTASPEGTRPRATSSVYSQPTPRLWGSETDIPPVPAIPKEHSVTKKQTDAEYLNAHFAAMTQNRRSLSADTIFENDSPDEERSRVVDDNDQSPLNRLSVNTEVSRPQSQGWWNVLLSPLLGRSDTLSSKKSPLSPWFSRASPSTPTSQAARAKEKEKEKEVSCFSPDTPETVVVDQWQEKNKSLEQYRSLDEAVPPVPNRQTAMSMMFPGNRVQGEAAEYYQACAHELFSKTPYFDCFNHVCSITPPTIISSQPGLGAIVTGDRGLALAEAEVLHNPSDIKDVEVATAARGLLIDVDTPSQEAMKNSECAKCSHLRVSTSSTASWASTAVDTVMDDEKSPPEMPQNTRDLVIEPPVQNHAPPNTLESAPAPAIFPPEPAPVPAPAPAPYMPPEPLMREAEPAPESYVAPQPPAQSSPPEMPFPAPAPYFPPEPPAQVQPPQIINNYHYVLPPSEIPPQAPVVVERAMPHYIPVYPSNNPFFPPQEKPQPAVSGWPVEPPVPQSHSEEPSQEPDITKMPEEFQDRPRDVPQEHERTLELLAPPEQNGPPQASEPISPAFQRAAGGPGAIQLSEVNAPAPAYAQHHRDAPLPERHDLYPTPEAAVMNPTGEIGPGEARRRRLEREDAAGKKVGGLWRGRGCFSKKGCFGRPGREGRLRRRWYLFIGLFFLIIVVLAVALATTLTKKGDETQVQSQWVNLTNYPPIQTGIMTIAGTEAQIQDSGCINIETLWSCALPKGTQQTQNEPYAANQPTFRVEIRYRNETSNTTGSSNSTSKRDIWTANPNPPSIADQTFLGNTTDDNAKPYAGEETPFYLSVLSAVHLSSTNIFRRSANSSSLIPAPTEDSDGSAAAATLYPLPSSQPVRLYNRGESSEHYGFYTYFDKSIFLQSKAPLNDSTEDYDSEDNNGGFTQADAKARCTWSQTRFLVQIWTNPSGMGYSLLSSTSTTATATATSTSISTFSTATSSSSATDYTRPGSFPYPVTVTVDRHGGDADKKRVYCYGIEDNGHYNFTEAKLQIENRSVGGTLINPASDSTSSSAYGGIDGGTGGCECQWVNWISTS